MDVDLKGSSIKRIMDNPGLAFVTQMVDKEILAKIYGENSKLYHESINFDVSKNNELPSMAVYSSVDDYERLSIERRFYLPRNVPVIMLYFYFQINNSKIMNNQEKPLHKIAPNVQAKTLNALLICT